MADTTVCTPVRARSTAGRLPTSPTATSTSGPSGAARGRADGVSDAWTAARPLWPPATQYLLRNRLPPPLYATRGSPATTRTLVGQTSRDAVSCCFLTH